MVLFSRIRNSINLKILSITFLGIISALLIWFVFAVVSFRNLREGTSRIVSIEMEAAVHEYYSNYIDQVSSNINGYIDRIFSEIHLLSGIVQTWFAHRDEFAPISDILEKTPYFRDSLRQGEAWIHNDPGEPVELFVPKYLLSRNLTMSPDIASLVDDTRFLDLLLPVFASQGVEKIQVFFQGGKDREIFRMAPWYGIGENIYAIYPEMNELPIWETFNPGLAEQWEELIRITGGDPEELNRLVRVTPPVQDGLSGNLVLTVSQPIAGNNYTTFEGTVSYDIPIENIIENVEEIEIYDTGFAFIAQSNGNLFGINDYGLEIFGLSGSGERTVNEGAGFNRLERFLSDSSIPEIRELDISGSNEPVISLLSIAGKDFFLVLKKLKGYQSWLPEKSFFKEQWTLGFVIPKDEVLNAVHIVENEVNHQMNNLRMNSIGISTIIVTILIAALYFFIKRVVTGLENLAIAADEIRGRNYNIELPVESGDEVGRLSRAFNTMSREIRKNISQLSRAVDESRENEDTYIRLFESVPDPVLVCSTEKKTLFVNDAFTKTFGWTINELNSGVETLVRGGIPEKEPGGKPFEAQASSSSGEQIDVSITGAPFRDRNGEKIGTVYNLRDVTQWKKAQEMMIQSEKVLTLGSLASGMAHDVRNPLAGAVQNVQNISNRLLGKNRKNDEVAEKIGISREKMNQYLEERGIPKMISAIIDSVKEANRSIDYMLSFNVQGKGVFRSVQLDVILDESIRMAELNTRGLIEFSEISIKQEFSGDIPSILCDRGKIEQAFLNILKNSIEAFHYGSTSKPEITIKAAADENAINIDFIDNGPGMDSAALSRAFEPFHSMGRASSNRGLGLALCHYIISVNHRGTMDLDSVPGKGVRIKISLPLRN